MRIWMLILLLLSLPACFPDVILIHPETKDSVICEYQWVHISEYVNTVAQQRCVEDYKKRGYEEQHSSVRHVKIPEP